jgi:hypothetical protein
MRIAPFKRCARRTARTSALGARLVNLAVAKFGKAVVRRLP